MKVEEDSGISNANSILISAGPEFRVLEVGKQVKLLHKHSIIILYVKCILHTHDDKQCRAV